MTGETDLQAMLLSMEPRLTEHEFVFCSFENASYGDHAQLMPMGSFAEAEGLTLIVPRAKADEHHVPYESVFRCITLSVHSSLNAVGLTAAFATRLTEHGISANVVAGYFHDHIFVQADLAQRALGALRELRDGDEQTSPTHVGIDGCRAGWFFVRERAGTLDFGVATTIDELMRGLPDVSIVFVDIPIGLHDRSGEPRGCDSAARKLLGKGRAASVFPAPIRDVLNATSYAEANATSKALAGKGLSQQAFGLVPKIREVDAWLARQPHGQQALREVHPELCFCALNGGVAMTHSKKTADGFAERLALLSARLPEASTVVDAALKRYLRKDVARDDIVDALVVLVTAMTPASQLATAPPDPLIDATGLRMEIVYPRFGHPAVTR